MDNIPKGKRPVKLLFSAVIVWQLVQAGITAKFAEPYPALAMPGFAGTMAGSDGTIRLHNVKCRAQFKDGRSVWITSHELLPDIPDAKRMPIMAHMFSAPPAKVERPPARSIKAVLFRGRTLSRARENRRELDPETHEWLKVRIRALYPSEELLMATFVWYEDIFDVNRVSAPAKTEPTGFREERFQ